jgi:hypothetical protein
MPPHLGQQAGTTCPRTLVASIWIVPSAVSALGASPPVQPMFLPSASGFPDRCGGSALLHGIAGRRRLGGNLRRAEPDHVLARCAGMVSATSQIAPVWSPASWETRARADRRGAIS